MKKTLVSSAVGLLVGIALVAWLQPNAGGATLVVVVTILVANLVGHAAAFLASRGAPSPPGTPK